MAYSPVNVANNILRRAFEEKIPVSPMKLQKLLYFVASEYGKRTHRPLLDEHFQAWQYGPVCRSVYTEFKPFGGGEITQYAKDATGSSYLVNESTDPDLAFALNRIWEAAKNFGAVQLSRITHAGGSAWSEAWAGNGWIDDDALCADETYVTRLALA